MSLRRNVLANYISQAYVTAIGILMVPVYMRYMGAEAYGLVGFFAVLQAWFQLLDVGLTPTVSREAARLNGGACTPAQFRRFFRALQNIFAVVAVGGTAALLLATDVIATRWLKAESLLAGVLQQALALMALTVGLRWMSGLYRAVLAGLEHQVLLSKLNVAVATSRFVLVVPVFIFIGTQPTHFFGYQLAVALAEFAFLVWAAYRVLPVNSSAVLQQQGEAYSLAGMLKFSLTVAFTGAVWVLVTQLDKLLLSRLLPLSEYGYFTVAVMAASGVNMVSGPISAALMPRLTKLSAMRDDQGLEALYCTMTRYMAALAATVSLTLAVFAEPILWAWTGDRGLAERAAPVMALYALGNGILAVGAFPYYLQFARGNLRLHLIGNALYAGVLVPTLAWASARYGATGAGWVWLGLNAALFLFWTPVVHRRWLATSHWRWLLNDVFFAVGGAAAVALSLMAVLPSVESRLGTTALIMLSAAVTAFGAATALPPAQRMIQNLMRAARFAE